MSDLLPDVGALADVPMSAAHGVSAVALGFALKYHGINTVQDGTLYQQYKLEGKNIMPLHLDMVIETAKQFELHIMGAPNRLSGLVLDAIADAISGDDEDIHHDD